MPGKVFVPDDRFAITPFAKGSEGRMPPKETTPAFDPMEEQLLPERGTLIG